MHQISLRAFSRLRYKDPRSVLIEMGGIERSIASADIDPRVKQMRTNDLRGVRELRQACLFWYGVSEVTGQRFGVAHCQDEDYDAVATWIKDGTQSFAPTQLKEVPPAALNPAASVQEIVNGLVKYPSSTRLTVAIHLNRVVQFAPSDLLTPPLGVAAVWVFGAIRPDRARWAI